MTWASWGKSWGGSFGGSWGYVRNVGPKPMRPGAAIGSAIASGPDALLSMADFKRKFGPRTNQLPRKKRNNAAMALLLAAIITDE